MTTNDDGPPLFDGEPEHCSLCGEPGHTHDDHWLFQHEPVQALVARLAEVSALLDELLKHADLSRRHEHPLRDRVDAYRRNKKPT